LQRFNAKYAQPEKTQSNATKISTIGVGLLMPASRGGTDHVGSALLV
jgi:hypothetical protein